MCWRELFYWLGAGLAHSDDSSAGSELLPFIARLHGRVLVC